MHPSEHFLLKCCALNTSSETLFLDHISPLASLLEIPLIISDEKNAELTAKYYPEVTIRYWPDLEFRLKEIANEFDALFECNYWDLKLKNVFKLFTKKNIRLIFCPHGQSDKGYKAPSLQPYASQETVLLYGNLLKEMLIELKIWPFISSFLEVGNFRFSYYQKHKTRLLEIANREIFSRLPASKRTILYAPTWQDDDEAGTFFKHIDQLLKQLPSDWNLIIKLHPLLYQKNLAFFYRFRLTIERYSNVLFVDQFPLIYPILEKIDAYLGDYSSIGYDVLSFQKPMFFLQQPHLLPGRLHRAGTILNDSEHFFYTIENQLAQANAFEPIQTELYKKTFADVKDLKGALTSFLRSGAL